MSESDKLVPRPFPTHWSGDSGCWDNASPKRRTEAILWEVHRLHARQKLQREVKAGRIVRPNVCQECGKAGKIHGHHFDYSKPTEVDWLCRKCHDRHDRNKRVGWRAER